MTKKYIMFFYRYMTVVCWMCLVVACTSGEGEEPMEENGTASFLLQVFPEGGHRTKAFGDDANAAAGEFIHSLWIFVTDGGGVIEKKIVPDLSADPDALSGNYLRYVSDEFRSGRGRKKVYAFANMDGVYPVGDRTRTIADILNGLNTGGTMDGFSALVVDDPAGGLDPANGRFIPMSVCKDINLQGTRQTEWIELVRLVGRIDIVVNNEQDKNIKISSLSMETFSDRVPLFAGGAVLTEGECRTRNVLPIQAERIIPSKGTSSVSFYVNATEWENSRAPFTVDLEVDGRTFSGTTFRTYMPRNSIYPLVLNFSDYQLKLETEAHVAPIGGYPVKVKATLSGNYVLELPEGCMFKITPTLLKKGNVFNYDGTWRWSLEGNTGHLIHLDALDRQVLEGNLAALAGQEGVLRLSTDVKEYIITIRSVSLHDLDPVETRSFVMPESQLYEWMDIRKK